ncbi:hypothetical protein PAAG_03134 [Paracoccidioides lutzii Pb01]|uniref:GPI anchored serine-threonine rich protein n=1 Tax=Paracoccidioides lutzii (strain ATCC MYA-826 / Pb01) TaxID=502779 RepID=C1GYI0_PARBA|nr:hypothetical protein PAAG_03134 [Paracoccidioides lutzii Pb01]EEH41571.1 hypothetical protein PAAG_03134 [Paracoccidioides lutzii Pb01]
MRSFVSVPAFCTILFGLVAAQTSKSPSSCDAQNILEACLQSTQALLKTCVPNDWQCLCTQHTNVLTCYNNCPNDLGRHGAESSKIANCNAASQFATTPTATPTQSPTSSDSGAEPTGSSSASRTASGTAALTSSATQTPNAAAAVGGVSMGMGGIAGLLVAGIGYMV